MSRSDIGNYLGIAEETVCRIFARFQDGGLISSDCRHIKLNDLERLQQLAHHRFPQESREVSTARTTLPVAAKV
jgi:CRP/FNR family transcriptional regulator